MSGGLMSGGRMSGGRLSGGLKSYDQAQHIPGVENRLCDSISRLRVTAEMLRHYGMQGQPTHIPEHLEPRNFKLQ